MEKFMLTAPNTIAQPAKVIDEPEQVTIALQALHPDLTVSLLQEAIRAGLEARNEATPASPPTAAGVGQWNKTVEVLRLSLMASQWHRHNPRNCPCISSPDRSITIVVMTGNHATGKSEGNPTNQAEKGAVAQELVEQNRQLRLDLQATFNFVKKACTEKQQGTYVWVLLYHYDKKANEVRFELSLPVGFNKQQITAWDARLILGNLPNNPAHFALDTDEPNPPATVDVAPKTGTF